MKNRTHLLLMELLIMVLVFAAAAAMCLRCFAEADRISQENSERDRAVSLVSSAAETLKACAGNVEETCAALGGSKGTVLYDGSGNAAAEAEAIYRLEIIPLESGSPTLGRAELRLLNIPRESEIYSLQAAWQEAAP